MMTTPTLTPHPQPSDAPDVLVELFVLDQERCGPCRSAIGELRLAATLLEDGLAGSAIRVASRVVQLTDADEARRLGVVSSPTVRVDGADIVLEVDEEECATCSAIARTPVSCRTYEWEGARHDHPPAALVVDAVRRHLAGISTRPSAAAPVPISETSVERFLAGVSATPIPYEELREVVTGRVSTAEDATYAEAVSPWNVAIDVHPQAVVEARTARDVAQTVLFARRHGLRVTPQATGHGPIASLVGDIVVATRGLDECTVNPEGWARVGAGVKWLRVVEAAAPHGLAPLSGSVTDVGVVGYTTGGGLGPMARTYGLASDRVRAFEVVTGDGELRRATPTEHPELYYALRGGKGALGIVTAVEFDLVRQASFYGGALWFDGAEAAAVMDRWRTWSASLPEDGTTSVALFRLPPLEGVPEVLAGRLTLSVRYVWTGSAHDGERHFAAMRSAGPVLLDDVRTKAYTEIDSVHTDPIDPMPVHEDALLLREFSADAVRALVDAAGVESESQVILVEIRQLGGAFSREGEHPSAFDVRHAAYSMLAVGLPGADTERDHAAVRSALAPWALQARLPNFSFTPEELAAAYRPSTRERLRAALEHYDPDRVLAISEAVRAAS